MAKLFGIGFSGAWESMFYTFKPTSAQREHDKNVGAFVRGMC